MADGVQIGGFAFFLQLFLQLKVAVEVLLDGAFALPMTIRMSWMPAATASSTTYWMVGVSTMGNISLGCDFAAGRKRVPKPAAGMMALRIVFFMVRQDWVSVA